MKKSDNLFLTELFKIKRFGKSPNLLVMEEILNKLKNPHKNLKFIHIAGTNGKGSVSNYLSKILIEAGYKVGLYTSPFIHRFNERMKINDIEISDEELNEIGNKVLKIGQALPYDVKQFDIITCVAMEWFNKNNCDYVVLEAGMGGRGDSTNIISPVLSVITTIDLDHTKILGTTVEEIAYEKAGIIKEDTPLIYYPTEYSKILIDECIKKNSRYSTIDTPTIIDKTTNGSKFLYKDKEYFVSMVGKYQVYNACMAIEVCEKLNVDYSFIKSGIRKMYLEGRFDIINDKPLIVADGGHNPQGAKNLIETINYLDIKNPVFIVSIYKEKDADGYIKNLKSTGKILFSSFDDDLCYNPSELGEKYGCEYIGLDDAKKMVLNGNNNDSYIFCGYLYQISKIKSLFDKSR